MPEMPAVGKSSGTPEWLRTVNDRVALRLLIEHGPLSRSQIRTLSGVSKPTASQMVLRLEQAGMIAPIGMTSGPRGRNAVVYALRPDSVTGVAMTVDATGIRAVLADPTGTEHPVVAVEPPQVRSPVADVRAAVEAASRAAGVDPEDCTRVVIGVPAAVHRSQDALEFLGTLPGWPELGAKNQIEVGTGLTTTIDNDANLSAVAEREAGTAQEDQDFIYLWLGRGLGAGLDIDGRPRNGATGSAGEIGYLELPLSAARIDPEAGDFTDLLGDEALFKMFDTKDFSLALRTLGASEPAQVDYAHRIALLIRPLQAVLDPALIILGGPTGNAGGSSLAAHVQEQMHAGPQVLTSRTGGNSVILGARSVLLSQLRHELERRIEAGA